jgi:PucR family transcriptional regulator, purine catabolism regulatory protein
VTLTIRQLTEIPSLRTRFLAGESGASKAVLWAHTCELPDPWNWLGTGDLLLTDGYNFPAGAVEQVEFLTNLARANLSGIALGEELHAPPLTEAAVAAAEALAFPVLSSAYSVPFVLVARTVADSNSDEAHGRIVRILRVYDILLRSQRPGFPADGLLGALSGACGAELHAVDVRTGLELLPSGTVLDEATRDALVETVATRTSSIPSFLRVTTRHGSALALPLDDDGQAVLLALPISNGADLVTLQHVATIAAMEVDRRALLAARRRESGAQFFRLLLDSLADSDAAVTRLTAAGLGQRPWRVLCLGSETEISPEDIQRRLHALRTPHLHVGSGADHLLFVSDAGLDDDAFGFAGQPGTKVGTSRPFHGIGRVADAAREARWALEGARTTGKPLLAYGDDVPMFLPRTVSEGEAAVAAVLGGVFAYDKENGTDLVHSLEVYFQSGRSWQHGAARLGIHKQTLIYRMRRVEELTGRKLADIDDQTQLYLAIRTWRMYQTPS